MKHYRTLSYIYKVKNNDSVVIICITTINNIGDIYLPSLGITKGRTKYERPTSSYGSVIDHRQKYERPGSGEQNNERPASRHRSVIIQQLRSGKY